MRTAITLFIVALAGISWAPECRAQRIRRVTEFVPNDVTQARIDDAGNRVVAWWQGDPLGSNPNRLYHLFLWDNAAESLTRLGNVESIAQPLVDITDDGNTIVFAAAADPLGTNPDLSVEIFSIGADGTGLNQVTNFAAGAGIPVSLAIAGSGNRIAFGGDLDPFTGNPSGIGRVFVIDPNGSGQLAVTLASSGELSSLSISDDGERLVFIHNGSLGTGTVDGQDHLYRIKWNRQELAQLAGGLRVSRGSISGDGQTIVYFPSFLGIKTTDWNEAATNDVFPCNTNKCSSEEALADDGAWVYFIRTTTGVPGAAPELARVSASGGTAVTVASPTERAKLSGLRVAGGESRLLAFIEDGELSGLPNVDGSEELISIGSTGMSPVRHTENTFAGFIFEPAIAPDGSAAVLVLGDQQIVAVDASGDNMRALSYDGGASGPAVSANGDVLFVAFDDLLAPTSCQGFAGGLIYRAALDGSAMQQVVDDGNCNTSRDRASISADGATGAWQANNDLWMAPVGGGAEVLLDDGGNGIRQNPELSADGDWLVFSSNSDAHLPGNVQFQVFRVPADGSLATEVITSDGNFSSVKADVSGDGTRIVFESGVDHTGNNPDHNREIFLWEESTALITQLTDSTSGGNHEPRISDNGRWVYFKSDSGYYGVPGDLAFRLDVDNGTLERITGTATGSVFLQGLRDRPSYSVGETGDRAVLANFDYQMGDSLPGGFNQLYFIEFDILPQFEVGSDDPTSLNWGTDPRFVGYDVIRGDLANLVAGANAGDADLGAVTCLETNSADTSLVGMEDTLQPTPGQGLFYLHRGRMGPTEPPVGWGPTSNSGERIPASGDCSNSPM